MQSLINSIPPWLVALLVSSGVGIGVSVFAKVLPKQKLINLIKKPCYNLGVMVSKFLILRLGKDSAKKVEEGIIVTILTVLGQAPLFIVDGLLSDNKKKGRKK